MQAPESQADFTGPTVDDPPPAWWQDKRVAIAAAAVIGVLVVACAWLAISAGIARERMAMMEARAAEGFLAPPSTARTTRLRLGSSASLGSGTPELLELRIEVRSSTFKLFRVSIGRDDGTAVLHFDRLQRDSNDEIRFALNSTMLPPGSYTVRVEGFTWRGQTEPIGRVSLRVVR